MTLRDDLKMGAQVVIKQSLTMGFHYRYYLVFTQKVTANNNTCPLFLNLTV
jgi:hypothetical protein